MQTFNVVWILKLQHAFSNKLSGLISVALPYEPHMMMGYFYRNARMYVCTHARMHSLSPFGFNLIIVNPCQDLSGQDGRHIQLLNVMGGGHD